MTVEDLLRRSIAKISNGGKPTPEMELQQALEMAKKAQAEAESIREELKKRDQDLEQRRIEEAQARAIQDYRDDAASAVDEAKHPFLAAYDPARVAEAALRAADAYAAKTGVIPAVEDILDYLEQVEREEWEARAPKLGFTKAPPPNDPAATAPARAPNGKFQPRAETPRTVSNQSAAARGEAPVDYRKMSKRERARTAGREVFGGKA